ncbi:fasciclin domain-containing protein [Flavobacterium sp.]|uniref:fasciclin domain-containing protein n=1 Tax=Flavobacterium sp. TaxID=239 RepID=UPI00286E5F92|nr:fasciclin domain-containing protein [Flavobacterium sp.]
MNKIKFHIGLLVIATTAFLSSCENDYENQLPSIAAIAVEGVDFSILEAAAIQGDVALTLSNSNPNDLSGKYTVFAPTNAGFARLGFNTPGSLGGLQNSFLTNTLLYAVSNGNLSSGSIVAGGTSQSALGPNRRFITRGSDKFINGSKIIATDVAASNGTVHVIDKVLIASGADIVQTAIALQTAQVFKQKELTFLVEAIVYAGLAEALTASAGSPSFTVFAPNDAAFKALGPILGISMNVPTDVRQIPVATLRAVLLSSVINDGGKFTSEMNAGAVASLSGANITFGAYNNGVLTVKGNGSSEANMVIPDVQTTNGVVHVIDRVLLP